MTKVGDVVLDPMMGSGTTIVEAFLAGRHAIGLDIDPLALRLCKTKTSPLPVEQVSLAGNKILEQAQKDLLQNNDVLRRDLETYYGEAEHKFIDYWFLPQTQLELISLLRQLKQIKEPEIQAFLELVFSSIIITKSGGVSMARDLAHTRPTSRILLSSRLNPCQIELPRLHWAQRIDYASTFDPPCRPDRSQRAETNRIQGYPTRIDRVWHK